MADKYLKHDGTGGMIEVEAADSSAGAGDAGEVVALDSTGRISDTMMPVGIGADTATLPTTDDLSAGDFVNIYDDTSVATIRKADATTSGKEAVGFVLAVTTQPNDAIVYFEGINDQVTGLTVGAMQFLDDTVAGGTTETAPSATGNVVQKLGRAISTTAITFEASNPIELV